MPDFSKPLTVPRGRLIWDLGGMCFWTALGVGLFAAVAIDRNVSKGILWLEFVPAMFLTFSTRDFVNHMRARGIRLQKEGLETAGERGPYLLEWKNVESVRETPGCSGGLLISGRKREQIFIPRMATGYEEIRQFIFQMMEGQKPAAKPSGDGNPQA